MVKTVRIDNLGKMRLFQRKDRKGNPGVWYVTLARGVHQSLDTRDEETARKILKQMEEDLLDRRLKRLSAADTISLGKFIEDYMGGRGQLSPCTLRADRLALEKFQDWYGNGPVRNISSDVLDNYRQYLDNWVSSPSKKGKRSGKRLEKNSINNYIRHLRGALKTAIRKGYIKDPYLLDNFRTYKVNLEKISYMTKAEVAQLLETAQKHPKMNILVPVMIYTGIARADSVRPIHISLIEGVRYIRYVRHKTGKPIKVPISTELDEYIGHLEPGIHRLTPYKSPDTVSHEFAKIVHQSGLKGVTAHRVRHTLSTLLLEAGAELAVVSELLGHTDISITKRFYLYIVDTRKKQTVELLKIKDKAV
ncbi:MAG: tyrosine-type recombinase/integrase [Nitrospiraceae bacterium]|nr:tyrosine-type recombinase/integrase [Nitrospiraceae bacterium]